MLKTDHQDTLINTVNASNSTEGEIKPQWFGGLDNNTNYFSVPYYFSLGFFDGAFNSTYIGDCRLHSIRLGANITLLTWNAKI
jgi:hypothetical protein